MKSLYRSYQQLDTRMIIGICGLIALAILVTSAIDSRKAARITGLQVMVNPLEGISYMIKADEVKKIVYEGYRRDVEDLTVGDVDIKSVEELLEKEPFIANADVYINADDRLDIEIEQAHAAVRIMDDQGRSYYLTKTGDPFPISKHASARVTLFSGKIDLFTGQKDSLTAVQNGVMQLIEIMDDNTFAKKMIEQVYINPKGEFMIQPKMGRFKFDLGKPVDLYDKIERMEIAYREVLPVKGWTTYKTIHLAYEDQIIGKK